MAATPPAAPPASAETDMPALVEARKAMRSAAEKVDRQRQQSAEAAERVRDAVAGLRDRLDAAGPRIENKLAELSAAGASLDDVRQRLEQRRRADRAPDAHRPRRAWLWVLLAAIGLAVAAGLAVIGFDIDLTG